MSSWPILSITTFLPILGILCILCVNADDETAKRTVRWEQSGYLYHYAFAMILGLIALLGGVWWAVTHAAL